MLCTRATASTSSRQRRRPHERACRWRSVARSPGLAVERPTKRQPRALPVGPLAHLIGQPMESYAWRALQLEPRLQSPSLLCRADNALKQAEKSAHIARKAHSVCWRLQPPCLAIFPRAARNQSPLGRGVVRSAKRSLLVSTFLFPEIPYEEAINSSRAPRGGRH